MAKNKKKKPAATDAVQAAVKPERKPNKKEQKAMAEAHNQEMAKKRKQIYGIAIGVALFSVLLSFWSGQYAGGPLYGPLQIACFALMGVSGAFFTFGSRYEVVEKQQNSKRSVGLVLMAISVGFVMVEVIKMIG